MHYCCKKKKKKTGSKWRKWGAAVPRSLDPHKEMLLMVVNSAAPHPLNAAVTCFFVFFSCSALCTAVVIIIPNQLLHRARLCVTLQRNAQVPVGHDEHTNQQGNLSETASVQRPNTPAFGKGAKGANASYCGHIWAQQRNVTSKQERRRASRNAPPLDNNALRARQYGRCGEVGHTCHLCEGIWKIVREKLPSAQSQVLVTDEWV